MAFSRGQLMPVYHALAAILCLSLVFSGCSDGREAMRDTSATLEDAQSSEQFDAGCPYIDKTECFFGEAFVECPGGGDSSIVCGSVSCSWVSNGCPVGAYTDRIEPDCICQATSCPHEQVLARFVTEWGQAQWTRDRALVVDVIVDPMIPADGESLDCSAWPSSTPGGDSPCSIGYSVFRARPGTHAIWYRTPGGLWGWWLLVELDAERQRARVCRVPFSDVFGCDGEPDCAISGQVTVNDLADSQADIWGRFAVELEDGNTLAGTF